MTDMIRRQILPAVSSYAAALCRAIATKEAVAVSCRGRKSPSRQDLRGNGQPLRSLQRIGRDHAPPARGSG